MSEKEAQPETPADEEETRSSEPGDDEASSAPGDDEALSEPDDDGQPDSSEAEPLLPVGNPVRLRALIPIVLGTLVGVLIMASAASPAVVVPVALVCVLLVTVGVLDLLGSFDDTDRSVRHCRLGELMVPTSVALGGGLCHLALLRGAVEGVVPPTVSAVAIPATFLMVVVGLYRIGERLGPWRVDETGKPRPLWRRHGFWLVVMVTLLYLPMLGNHSLSDPWETHYGEVAREILARNDWISLWWAQDGWFWSKPVLSFWLQAGAMALFGVRFRSGEMLSAVADGRLPQPEWAVRWPFFLITLVAVYLLYKGVARSHGRRPALLGAMVLVTMPQFFLLAHQTMTDMPFVACLAAAIGLFIYATQVDAHERIQSYEVGLGPFTLRLSLYHLVIGAVLMVVLPQILYLLSRNLSLIFTPNFDLRFHGDVFDLGSAGNCGLPGNKACQEGLRPVVKSFTPAVQALVWLQALALVLWLSWGERRVQRLVFLAAWLCASLATMTKGPAGIGLPVLAALAYVVATRRWRDLTRMEIIAGALIFVATVLPWFVAMHSRHGQPFTDRLLFHDMFKRAFKHVHDTNRGQDLSFRYYVWQLGYAVFPWTGLAPLALVRWLRQRRDTFSSRGAVVLAAWFLIGFSLFAVMGTKFHHYCFPVLPPLAMLIGVLLDDMLVRGQRDSTVASIDQATVDRVLLGAVAVGAAVLTYMVGRDLVWSPEGRNSQIRLIHLITYNYGRPWPKSVDFGSWLWGFTIAATGVTLLLMIDRLRRYATVALLCVATAFAAWGVNSYLVKLSPHWGQRELFLAYERARQQEEGQLIAYQMNWKGENFYRGNQVPAFVSSGSKFQKWIDEQKKTKDQKVFYFVTEHKRARNLKNELGSPGRFEKLTDPQLNNKFQLVRAVFE